MIKNVKNRTFALTMITLMLPLGLQGAEWWAETTGTYAGVIANVQNGDLVWGDYDSDGLMDVFLIGHTGAAAMSALYRNTGTGWYIWTTPFSAVSDGSIDLGDYNGDGKIDVLITGQSSTGPVTEIWTNGNTSIGGSPNYTKLVQSFPGLTNSVARWVDYDNDGDLDFFLSGWNGGTTVSAYLYRNDNGTFNSDATAISAIPGVRYGDVEWGDFDSDGDMDLAITGEDWNTTKYLRVYRNNGGTFTLYYDYAGGITHSFLEWGDMDNDGDLDLIVSGETSATSGQTLYLQNTGATFVTSFAFLFTANPTSGLSYGDLDLGDFDNDGDLDVLFTGHQPFWNQDLTEIWYNIGGGNYSKFWTLMALRGGSVAFGDYNNDKQLDGVISGDGGGAVTKLYIGQGASPNSAPNGPTISGSPATTGNATTFSWNSTTDPIGAGWLPGTVPAGLTYNLRIGTTSGGQDIMSAHARSDGGLTIPEAGNTGAIENWTINNLAYGTYYWAVQAIDHGYAASGWSTEQTFTIIPPAMSGTYTIGPVPNDYQTFTAAVADLMANGVSGPVTFNVIDGSYNEQVTIGVIPGAGVGSEIVFKTNTIPSSANVILQFDAVSSTDNWVIKLDGTSHVTFQDMTIAANDVGYARVIVIDNNADYITIRNNMLVSSNSATSGTNAVVIFSDFTSADVADNLLIENNDLDGGVSGIYIDANAGSEPTGLRIEGNTLSGQWYNGIYLRYNYAPTIGWNTLTARSGASSYDGMELQYCKYDMDITENVIDVAGGGRGMYLYFCLGQLFNYGGITNNVVHVGGAGGSTGIYINQCDYQEIYHNSVNITGSSLTSGRAIQLQGGGTLDIQNNIFANSGGGYAIYNYDTTMPTTFNLNYNNYYTPGNFIGALDNGGAPIRDLAKWQTDTGKDLNSLSINPAFTFGTNLNTDLKPRALQLDNLGSNALLGTVSDDIDGALRSVTAPDMGAYEYTATGTALTGTYPTTIASVANFSALENDLTILGVSGPLTVNVADGIISDVHFTILPVAGATSVNRITIASASGNSTLTSSVSNSTDNFVIHIAGADHVDINNLTLTATGSYARVIYITGGADDLNINANTIVGMSTGSDRQLIYSYLSIGDDRVIQNNSFTSGSHGIYYNTYAAGLDAQRTLVLDNIFSDQTDRGVYLEDQDAPVVSRNTFNATAAGSGYRAIDVQYSSNNTKITRNRINAGSGYGIYVNNCTGNATFPGKIKNNAVQVGGSSTAYGIYVYYSAYYNVYHNSVEITSTYSTARAFYSGSSSTNVNVINNIFANFGSGYAYYVYTTSSVVASDNNVLYSNGTNLAYWGGAMADLPALQAASSLSSSGTITMANTIEADPVFVGGAGSDPLNIANNSPAIGMGDPNINSVGSSDILNYLRPEPTTSIYQPDAGAYENALDATGNDPPTVFAEAASNIGANYANLNTTVNPNGTTSAVYFEYGLTTAYGTKIAARQSPLGGIADLYVATTAADLLPNTTYHYRAVAANSGGVTPGPDVSFTTQAADGLLANGSFEGNMPNYFGIGGSSETATVRWTGDQRRTGGHSLKINKPDTNGDAFWQSEDLFRYWASTATSSNLYVGAWIKLEGVNINPVDATEEIQLVFNFYDASGADLPGTPVTLAVPQSQSTTGWVEVQSSLLSLTQIPVAVTFQFKFGSNATGIAWVDDIFSRPATAGEWAGSFFNPNVDVPTGWFYWWPDYGQGKSYWEGSDSVYIARNFNESLTGNSSLEMVKNYTGHAVTVNADVRSFANDGRGLEFSTWLKTNLPTGMANTANSDPTAGIGFTVLWHDGTTGADGWGLVGTDEFYFTLAGDITDWTQYSFVVAPPAGAIQFELRARTWDNFVGTTYWDDFKVDYAIPPSIPTGLAATALPGLNQVRWDTNPASENVALYSIYRTSTNPPVFADEWLNDVISTGASSYVYDDTDNIIPGSAYFYWVSAENIYGLEGSPAGPTPVVVGLAPIAHSGGPDAFGYTWIGSDDPGSGLAFDWVELSGLTTPLTFSTSDDGEVAASLSFSFPFYENNYTSLLVGTNGYLTFGAAGTGLENNNDPIPTTGTPNDLIALFWDDLLTGAGSPVYAYNYNDGVGDRFIVQYNEVLHYSPTPGSPAKSGSVSEITTSAAGINDYTMQAQLYPDGTIILLYQSMTGDLTTATIGIENAAGSDGLQVPANGFTGAYVHDGVVIKFDPPQQQQTVIFNVDMNALQQGGLFDPVTDNVLLRGDWPGNNWGNDDPNAGQMDDSDSDLIYTRSEIFASNSYHEYKFWYNDGSTDGVWEADPNRGVTIAATDIVLPVEVFRSKVGINTGSALFAKNRQRIRVLNDAPVESNIANSAAYQIGGNQITLEAWVYPVRPVGEGEEWLIYNLVGYVGGDTPYQLRLAGNGFGAEFDFTLNDGTQWLQVVATGATFNTWTHVAGTYDGTTMRIYINGVEANSLAASMTNISTNGVGFYIGDYGTTTFGGLIDEVRLWDYARSSNDINTAKDNALVGTEPGLQGYWPLDEISPNFTTYVDPLTNDTGLVLEDKSGNNNHLWAQWGATTHSGIFQDGTNDFEPFFILPEILEAAIGEYASYRPLVGGSATSTITVVQPSPTGVAFNDLIGEVEWTPVAGQEGYQIITLEASNGVGSTQVEFTVWVGEYPTHFMTHTNGTQMSVFNDGHLGAVDGTIGDGFSHALSGGASKNALFQGGLAILQGSSGAVVHADNYGFTQRSRVNPTTSPIAGYEAYVAIYDDSRAGSPFEIGIRQVSNASTLNQADEYVIVNYEVHNFSGADLTDMYIAVYADWDIGDDPYQNAGGYEPASRLLYAYDAATTAAHSYYGLAAMNPELSGAIVGNYNIYRSNIVYDNRNVIDSGGGMINDIKNLIVVGPYTIPADGKISKAFAFIGANDQASLLSNTSAAQAAYDSMVELSPPAIPTGLTAVANNGYNRIGWNSNSEPNMDYYSIYRSMNQSDPDPEWIGDVYHPVNWFNDLRTVPGNQYYYWVSAVDDGFLESDPAGPVSATATGALVHEGSDGTFGYTWMTNFAAGGPGFSWSDISTVGVEHSILDEGSVGVTLPWDFPFYGLNEVDLRISDNGYILFGPSQTDWQNQNLPDMAEPNHLIAPFWTDLEPSTGASIYSFNDAANNRFIVQWDGLPPYTSSGTSPPAGSDAAAITNNAAKALAAQAMSVGDYTFQVRLYPNGNIEFAYQSMTDITDMATVGIENHNGTDGLAIVYNSVLIQDGLQININAPVQFVEGPFNLQATSGDGRVDLAWEANTTAEFVRYELFRSQQSDPASANWIADISPSGVHDYTDTGVTNGTTYYYWVLTVNDMNGANVFSPFSNMVSATPQGGGAQPTAHTEGASDITETSARLHGVVYPDGVNMDMFFDWGTSPGELIQVLGAGAVAGMDPVPVVADLTGLAGGNTYYFELRDVSFQHYGGVVHFTTPTNANTVVEVAVVDVNEPIYVLQGVQLDFTSGLVDGAVLTVAEVIELPAGTPPDAAVAGIAVDQYWDINLEGGTGTIDVSLTFDLPAGTFTQAEINDLANLVLFHRPSGTTGAWNTTGNATGATTNSVTFAGISSFSEFTIGLASLAEDLVGPSVTNSGITSTVPAPIGQAITVQATITDPSGIASADLNWKTGVTSGFSPITMSHIGNDVYEADVSGSDVTLAGILLYIHASDNAGNDYDSPVEAVTVAYGSGQITSNMSGSHYVNGIPSDEWVLISVPGVLDQTSIADNFGDELANQGEETWKIYRTVNGTATSANTIVPGQGYWLQQRIADNISISVGSGRVLNLDGFDINLTPGWNLIGNPFPYQMAVNFDQNLVHGPRAYNTNDWGSVGNTLQPWGGYAVYIFGSSNRTITLVSPSLSKEILAKENEPINGWEVNLSLNGNKYADHENRIGRRSDALDERDKYDSPEPPFIEGYISLSMSRPEWGEHYPAFTNDIRSSSENDGTWKMSLNTKGESGPIDVDFSIEGEIPVGTKVVLMDLIERAEYDLTAGEQPESITRYHEGFSYPLLVIAGSDAYVRGAVDEAIAALPQDFTLGRNYPNPFNPSTKIPYSVMRPARISLRIYNLLGQEVAALYDGWQDMGDYLVTWNGADRSGQPVASGIYFAVYRAEGRMDTQKMLMMK